MLNGAVSTNGVAARTVEWNALSVSLSASEMMIEHPDEDRCHGGARNGAD